MEKILTQKMIEDYQNDGVVFIPGMFKQSVEKLRNGIEQNMKEPGPYATENLHAHELGRFFDDYCNWNRIQTFYEVIQQPFIAEIAAHLDGYTVIVTKSTVPVGTGQQVSDIVHKTRPDADFDVASNPEFLREGSAISDFMRPDRVVVGTSNERAIDVMRQLYRPLFLIETPILFTSLETAELTKYAANAFLAVKISYINRIADLCEKVNADVHDVAKGMGLDKRIGGKFLHPVQGYGGSCFPKDTLALVKTAEFFESDVPLVSGVVRYNSKRKQDMAQRVIDAMKGNVEGKKIAILGLAFKPETDDMRESPSIELITELTKKGAVITAYDPAAMVEAKPHLPASITYAENAASCLTGADCAVLVTEWNEFRALTPLSFTELMAGNVLVDLRNVYDPSAIRAADIHYSSIGRA